MINFPKRKNPKFFSKSDFIILEKIGCGSFSEVFKVQKKNSSEIFALKIMNLENLTKNDFENIKNEIKIQKTLKNENCLKLVDYFEESNFVYLLLEYCDLGNLYNFLQTNKLEKQTLKKIFYEICLGIQYLHKNGIIMRDIKLENILLKTEKIKKSAKTNKNKKKTLQNPNKPINKNKKTPKKIKICDFGWSTSEKNHKYAKKRAGTPCYMSPESIKGNLQKKSADIWSLGILLYELFFKTEIFKGVNIGEILTKIENFREIDFSGGEICGEGKELVRNMVVRQEASRWTIGRVLGSEFFSGVRGVFFGNGEREGFWEHNDERDFCENNNKGFRNVKNHFYENIHKGFCENNDQKNFYRINKNNFYENNNKNTVKNQNKKEFSDNKMNINFLDNENKVVYLKNEKNKDFIEKTKFNGKNGFLNFNVYNRENDYNQKNKLNTFGKYDNLKIRKNYSLLKKLNCKKSTNLITNNNRYYENSVINKKFKNLKKKNNLKNGFLKNLDIYPEKNKWKNLKSSLLINNILKISKNAHDKSRKINLKKQKKKN